MATTTSNNTRPARIRRPVAILGGNRIPFARSDGAYAQASNQDMFTAALDGLADRFDLAGERLDMVIGGAVLKHSRDFNLMRECVLGSSLSPYTPAFDLQQACGTGLQAAIAAADGIAAGRYEVAAAGGVDTTSDAPIAFGDDLRRTLLGLRRSKSNVERLKLVGRLPASLGVQIPTNGEPRTGLVDGRARCDHRQADGHQAGRPGRAGRRQSPQHGRRLRPRVLRRSRHPVPRCRTATTTCDPTRHRRSWPHCGRCSASRTVTRR